MSQFPTDKSRLETVLEMLPERLVNDLVKEYLYNAYYPNEFTGIFSKYADYKKEELASFSNRKIRKFYKKMNEKFDVLNSFLIDHFWVPKGHYEMHDNPPFRYLEPRIHHNFRISEDAKHGTQEEDSKEWDRYYVELNNLAEDFERAYRSFIKIARKKIDTTEKKKWWETTWFQVVALFGAMASLLGLYLFIKSL